MPKQGDCTSSNLAKIWFNGTVGALLFRPPGESCLKSVSLLFQLISFGAGRPSEKVRFPLLIDCFAPTPVKTDSIVRPAPVRAEAMGFGPARTAQALLRWSER